MTQLDDNLDSLAAGDAGAPNIETAAITDLAVTTAKIAADSVSIAKLDASLEADHLNGIVRGWVSYDNVGTANIRDSFNVSSVTDNGAGDFTVNWNTNFANANYSVVATSQGGTPEINTIAAGSVRIIMTISATPTDLDPNCVIATGDQ